MAAPARTTCVKALSKNVLQMKFMQRCSLKHDIDAADLGKHKIDDEHWVLDSAGAAASSTPFTTIESYAQCEELHWGRMSFKGFNPDVERLMKVLDTEQALLAAEEREKQIAVSDHEMASRYESLVGTIANKFRSKKERRAATPPPDAECATLARAGNSTTDSHQWQNRKRKPLDPPDHSSPAQQRWKQ